MKIISGGQSGVDRAALDAALEAGVPAGGWCPEGRLAEDGPIPERYPLDELPGAGYAQRTLRNVVDSDGTVILHFGIPSGGTAKTVEACGATGKPHVLIDADSESVAEAAERIRAFVERHRIEVLNLAGPRASGEPRAYGYALAVMREVLGGAG